MKGSRVRRLAVGVVAGVFLTAVAWTAVGPQDTDDPAEAARTDRPSVSAPRAEGIRFRPLPASAPVRLEVPSVDIDAAVDPIGLTGDAVLEPPADIDRVGWWSESARPGADAGQTVMTGHSVHTGAGEMTRLVDVEPGAAVDVVAQAGRMRYRVADVEVIGRDELSRRAEDIFGQDRRAGRLVLVTCANWNGSEWEDNLVVFARPLGSPRPARGA